MVKKNHELRIKVSSEQLLKIKQKAETIGMSVSDFIRFVSLESKINVEAH